MSNNIGGKKGFFIFAGKIEWDRGGVVILALYALILGCMAYYIYYNVV